MKLLVIIEQPFVALLKLMLNYATFVICICSCFNLCNISCLNVQLLNARDMARRTVISSDRIVYTTEKDFLDQDYETRDWDERFRELEKWDWGSKRLFPRDSVYCSMFFLLLFFLHLGRLQLLSALPVKLIVNMKLKLILQQAFPLFLSFQWGWLLIWKFVHSFTMYVAISNWCCITFLPQNTFVYIVNQMLKQYSYPKAYSLLSLRFKMRCAWICQNVSSIFILRLLLRLGIMCIYSCNVFFTAVHVDLCILMNEETNRNLVTLTTGTIQVNNHQSVWS